VPAWFGVGYAFSSILEKPGASKFCQTMAREFPLFIDLIRNVEMALARSFPQRRGSIRFLVRDGRCAIASST